MATQIQALERNVRLLWLMKVFDGAIMLSVSTIVVFWSGLGMNDTQIAISQAAFLLTVALLELPTGYFADRVTRRCSLLGSAIMWLVGLAVYLQLTTFAEVIVAEMLLACAAALNSGARTALLYESLGGLGRASEFPKISSRMGLVGFAFLVLYSAVGSVLSEVNPRLPFAVQLLVYGGLLVLSLKLIEPPGAKLAGGERYLQQVKCIVVEHLVHCKRVRWILVFTALVVMSNQAGFWLYQKYFAICGVEKVHFGLIFAAFNLVAGTASLTSAHLVSRERLAVALLPILSASGYLLLGSVVGFWSFGFMFLHQIVRGTLDTVTGSWLNTEVDSSVRATVLSLGGLLSFFGMGASILGIGLIADHAGIMPALMSAGGLAVAVAIGVTLTWTPRSSN